LFRPHISVGTANSFNDSDSRPYQKQYTAVSKEHMGYFSAQT
jgi:hypothetical protein